MIWLGTLGATGGCRTPAETSRGARDPIKSRMREREIEIEREAALFALLSALSSKSSTTNIDFAEESRMTQL